MPATSNVLQVVINGKNNALPAFKSATQMMARFGAVSAAALTVAAVRAGQFEKGMAEISTLLDGDVTPAIEDMREELLKLSVDFGQTVGKMTKARYDIISAGFTDAAESAMVLNAAGKLAVAGVSDIATAADLVTDALGGLELGAEESGRVVDVLFQTVRKGKTTIDQLGQGFGKLFGTAKTANVSLEELGAAMATATASGVKTTEAITGLNALILAIAAPTKEASDAMLEAGIDIRKGFMQSIIDVGNASGESLAELRKLIPSVEALRVAAKVAGNVDLMAENLTAMANAAGVTEEAFEKMSETFDLQSKQARAALDALVITAGTSVLPVFTKVVGVVRDTAVMIRFLATETQNGAPLWKAYIDQLIEAVPGASSLAVALGFVGDRLKEMDAALDQRAFDQKVTEQMKIWQQDAEFIASFKEKRRFAPDTTDLASLREFAELWVKARQEIEGTGDAPNVIDRIGAAAASAKEDIAAMIAEIKALMDAANRALVPAETVIQTGFEREKPIRAEDEEFGPASGKELDEFESRQREKKKIADQAAQDEKERLDDLKEQVASLAEFTSEDFAQMAFSIGDSFAMVATDIGAHMLGLTKGPLMLGRAFKSMAAGILGDIARIIARLLVAKALMAAFGGGGGFLGALVGGLTGTSNAFGGTIPNAAFGMAMPGGGGFDMPAMVVPGAPGLDRSLVLGHGGEVMIPRTQVDAIDRARKFASTKPPPARRNRARRGNDSLTVQAIRPFRREEQNLLVDSVDEAENRSSRHKV